MAWPFFYRDTPNTVKAWGYKFELTDKHMRPEQYEPLKHTYDTLGEAALNKLNEISPPPSNPREAQTSATEKEKPSQDAAPNSQTAESMNEKVEADRPSSLDQGKDVKTPPKRDLYALLRDHADEDDTLRELWQQVNMVPDWVDWDQLARGQDVFYRYGGPIVTGLAYQSLLGGMGAGRVVETLARTGGFSKNVALHRLFETTQHVLQCTKSLESIQPGGEGFASTIRVRLLHASVRNRILKLAKTRPEYFDSEKYGVPINDIDSVGTIVMFSSALVFLSLPRQGIYLRKQEIEDYCALWRYIAYLIGCPTEGFFETVEQNKRILEGVLYWEIQPSHTSQILANNVIKCLQDRPPAYTSADFLIAGARWLNGNELCDALGLPRPSVYYSLLMAGQCIFFAWYCYSTRAIEKWEKPKIKAVREIFWNIVVKNGLKGQETAFDFKYVPEYSTITEMGQDDMVDLSKRGIEKRNLKWLVIAVVMLGLVVSGWVAACVFGVRLTLRLAKSAWSFF